MARRRIFWGIFCRQDFCFFGECVPAAPHDVCSGWATPCVAGAFLAEELAGGTLDLTACACGCAALPAVGVEVHVRLLEQVWADLATEKGLINL